MATEGSLWINGEKYDLLADSALPSGRRGLSRSQRPSQPSDPGRIRMGRWKLSGPLGPSRELPDGFLGHDFSDNIETRYNDLVTSIAARNALTLTSQDPSTAGSVAAFAGFAFGASGVKFGGAVTAQDVAHINEDRAHLFFDRGRITTQVDPSDWAVVAATTHDVPVLGSAVWRGKGYLGLGETVTMRRRISVTSSGASYQEALGSTYAKQMTVGNDRLWMVNAAAANSNKAFYSLDDLATVSNSFAVGDPEIGATGIGTLGPLTVFGTETGNFSFTDAGKPVRMSDSLRGHRSQNNGIDHASIWGWQYSVNDLGIDAWDGGVTVNPVGVESLIDFEGDIDGRPLAVFAWRDSLFASYLTTAGHSYILRGMFGPETAATGRPQWFPFRRLASTEARTISATSVPTNPTIVVSEDTNAAYYTMGRRGRDIADSNYVFSTDGGTWNGSTMMRDMNMTKNVRYANFLTENCDGSNTWQLSISPDEGSYVNVGSAIATDGRQQVFPVTGSTPLTTVSFHTLKPRLTQVAASSSSPPQIRGFLDIVYDERPDMITEVVAILDLGKGERARTLYDNLVTLVDRGTTSPDAVRLPDDFSDSQGFVADVSDFTDSKGDGVIRCTVRLHLWEVS